MQRFFFTYKTIDNFYNHKFYDIHNEDEGFFKPFPKNEILYHACEWDKNYFSQKAANDLSCFLGGLNDFNFCFIEDLV